MSFLRSTLAVLLLTFLPLAAVSPAHAAAADTAAKKQQKTPAAAKKKKSKGTKPAIQTAGKKTGKTVYTAKPGKKGAKKGVAKKRAAATAPAKGASSAVPQRRVEPTAPVPAVISPGVTAPVGEPAVITEVRYWTNPDFTRISITLDREVKFEDHQIRPVGQSAPARVYLDIANAKIGHGVKDVPIGDGLLKMVRVGQFRPDTVRVVLDADNIRDYKVFSFSDPFRVIIDVKGERKTEIAAVVPEMRAAPPPETVRPLPDEKPAPKRLVPPKIRRIVIDPGHGGHDPGAVGAEGTREKDVVLAISLLLAEKVRDRLGIEVVMTRSTDIFIPLQERTAIANKVNADLFVSVHANAAPNRAASGIETYYLNLAKSEKTAQLAARENGTSLDKVSVLQAILFDLMANYKLNDSAHLAESVQRELHNRVKARYPDTNNYGVKQGPFYVLVGATMPSILVEAAFLSNATEEKRLADPTFQDLAAEGIFDGINAYTSAIN